MEFVAESENLTELAIEILRDDWVNVTLLEDRSANSYVIGSALHNSNETTSPTCRRRAYFEERCERISTK